MNKCVLVMNQVFFICPVNRNLFSTQHTLKKVYDFSSFLGPTQSLASTVFTSVMKLIPSLNIICFLIELIKFYLNI
jgi:hypothetical protein